jgi:uncharacterized protein YjbI with pentapeptide repeats
MAEAQEPLSRRRKAPPEKKPPAIAEKAHDLEAIKKSLEDATSVGAGFWLSYLFLMFYLAIAAGAVTHVDLLLENPVKLPFLNVELPLKAFFFVAPILFLIVHVFTLSKLRLLADKARRFHDELKAQIKDGSDRDGLRRQLPSNVFVQFLAGPKEVRESWFDWLLKAMGWMSMAIAPVLLLLLLQLQFLPYHESWLTWTQRVALALDLGLLWWLWRHVIAYSKGGERRQATAAGLWMLGGGATLATLAFSWLVATFPGEWGEKPLSPIAHLEPKAVTEWVFGWARNEEGFTVGKKWFANKLYLPELEIHEALKLDDPKKLDWKAHTIDLRERNFKGAYLERTNLGKADLRGVQLQGANLIRAQLQGANFRGAQLQGAILFQAHLQAASLIDAQLQGADLSFARLQGATLSWAHLQGANLYSADLRGALLLGTQLQGAVLGTTLLLGARLGGAYLIATDLRDAFLWRTSWPHARLESLLETNADGLKLNWRPEGERTLKGRPAFWTDHSYRILLKDLTAAIRSQEERVEALRAVEILDCNKFKQLASCDPKAAIPPEVKREQTSVERAGINEVAFQNALAAQLREFLCSGNTNMIYALRGIVHAQRDVSKDLPIATGFINSDRLSATGPHADNLVDFLMSKDCPISGSLSDEDKGRLLQIKREAEKQPPPA